MKPLLGAHLSIAGGVDKALDRAAALGCTTLQIFTRNQRQWNCRPLNHEEVARFHQQRRQTGMGPVFSHAGYLINLASPRLPLYQNSLHALTDELRRASLLGLSCVVLHPGSHLGRGEETALRQIARALDEVVSATKNLPPPRPRLALEVTAGQGTNLGWRFEHLSRIYEMARHPKHLAICLDTCHLFAAGHDIRTAAGYEAVLRRLERLIGLDQVLAIHLNDSLAPLGSRVDRHTHIGRGCLGLEPFRLLMNDPRFRRVPKVIETPKEQEQDGISRWDELNLNRLRHLLRRLPARP